jgi:light-regulated signal transduction histidine kinase (bacteriophytochrome)
LQYIAIALLVLLISTLGSIAVSLWFQRRISRPILDLAMTAKSVTRDKDFSVRAPPTDSADEIGQLIETFNEMLARIQEQNRELQMSRDDLEQRVGERTAELESANRELEAFSYSVSHDLRAPLRSIDGFSQALLEDYQDKLDDEGQNHLQRVRSATQRMAQLIDDMLDLSRVTRAEINREQIDLSALARSLPAELQKAEPGREVEFVIADGLVANGDARLLRIVLENLFRNAWKFTGKHQRAKIEFAVTQNNGNSAYYVRDDGAGFDMAYVNKLFGAFQRLHAMSEFDGTGVGLATVQRIIRRHGGRVWAEGEVEKGATFYFTL